MPPDNIVHSVRTLEDAERIISTSDNLSFKLRLEKLIVGTVVFFANICISLLRQALFQHEDLMRIKPRNIVVYTVGIVGDNVVILPALAAIRRKYPDALITVISNCQIWSSEGARQVLGPSRFKDRLIIINDYPVERCGFRIVFNRHLFPDVKCDLFINLSPFGNRGWIGAVVKEMLFAYKLGAVHAVGFHVASYSRNNWFNGVKHHFVRNEPRRGRHVLAELGLAPVENEDLFERDPAAKEAIITKLRSAGWPGGALYVVHPGAKFPSKCWPGERFGAVARYLSDRAGGFITVTGSEGEREITRDVIRCIDRPAADMAGKTTVQELVELLRLSSGCVTNDTGTMHIAAMVGVPAVALFTVRMCPMHWLPLGENVISLFSLVGCRYCYNDACESRQCLNNISVDHAMSALNEIISKKRVKQTVAPCN